MQRESARCGFLIQHQKVALRVDLAGFIRGYTEIPIVPNIPSLHTIHANALFVVSRLLINVADFVLHDPFGNLGPTKPNDAHSFPEIKLNG